MGLCVGGVGGIMSGAGGGCCLQTNNVAQQILRSLQV